MKRNFGPGLIVSAALAWMGTGKAAEPYAEWKYSSDLILDTSPAGAGVASTLADFPVLVRLTSGNFPFSEARGRGQDIRFSKADGTRLPYQIDRWDSAKALADVWVKVDTVRGDNATQSIRLHWGNSAAADSSNGSAVFNNRQVDVWHLGGDGRSPRANSVTGGAAAVPVNFDGDESTDGIIGLADSLDGRTPGDYLDIGNGYSGFRGEFMFSIWVCPASMHWNAPFLELGNGMYSENLMLSLAGTTDDFMFSSIDPDISTVEATSSLAVNEWQFLAVTVDRDRVKLYKNGRLESSGRLDTPLSDSWRASNFLGRSSWVKSGYFQGKLDEPEIHRVAHSDAWIKLTYQNQKADQNLVILKKPNRCVERFSAPPDTSVAEGGNLILSGIADCAGGYTWSPVSGPVPRIFDPDVKELQVRMPRVTGETELVFRFTALYRDSSPTREVRVRVLEAIPDPVFSFPAGLGWNGNGYIAVRPVIANLAEIKASPEPALNWAWTLSGPRADSIWLKDGILLAGNPASGELRLGLCLDNNGPATCGTVILRITPSVSLSGVTRESMLRQSRPGFDASGRMGNRPESPHEKSRVLFQRNP